ncbi:unnamed protein product [Sphagnum jensenii]|uniref:Uncharacterized protein n=1 Tax=Sphagnum jensenii TaxID=128206 RepID=A0ABP1B5A6_9BRYO
MDQQEGSRSNRPTGMDLPGRGDNPKHRQCVRIQENLPHMSHPSHRLPHHHHTPGGLRTCQSLRSGQPSYNPQAGQGPPPSSKKPLLYWILGFGFISDLQWDLGNWHWQQTHNMGDALFFSYSSKRGYQNARKPHHPPSDHRIHPKVEPSELHDRPDYCKDLAQRLPAQGGGPHLGDPQQRAPGGHVVLNHGALSHLQRLRPGPL